MSGLNKIKAIIRIQAFMPQKLLITITCNERLIVDIPCVKLFSYFIGNVKTAVISLNVSSKRPVTLLTPMLISSPLDCTYPFFPPLDKVHIPSERDSGF